MTQSSQPFSVRTGRAQSRPPQTENFDKETKIRLKKVMAPKFSQMGGDAKALVDGFFTVDPDGVEWQGSFNGEPACWVVPLRREEDIIYVSYDENLPIDGDADSEHIDWRDAIRQTLSHLLGGDNWPMAFDLCEFLLAKHDEFIRKQERLIEIWRNSSSSLGPFYADQDKKKMNDGEKLRESAIRQTNEALKRMNVGYRLREPTGRFDSVISSASEAVDKVLDLSADTVREQMARAIAVFGPHSGSSLDYGAAAKYAIHAVWTAMHICTGKEKFSDGVGELKKLGKLHPAFAAALVKLFGFTSQEGMGARHAAFEDELSLDMATSRFVVGTCASFIAYIAESHPDKFESKREKNRSEDIPF